MKHFILSPSGEAGLFLFSSFCSVFEYDRTAFVFYSIRRTLTEYSTIKDPPS